MTMITRISTTPSWGSSLEEPHDFDRVAIVPTGAGYLPDPVA